MDLRTSKRLVALLAAEIEQAARRILTRDDDAGIEEILAHVELQISFMREVRYRSAPLQENRSAARPCHNSTIHTSRILRRSFIQGGGGIQTIRGGRDRPQRPGTSPILPENQKNLPKLSEKRDGATL